MNHTFQYQNIGLPEDILQRKLYGDFEGAIDLIDKRLNDTTLSKSLRNCLQVYREMICRLPEEYPYTKEEAFMIIRNHIPDFSEKEFDTLLDERKIYWIYNNGEMRIFNRFFNSLCKAEPNFAQKAGIVLPGVESATKGSKEESRLDVCIKTMKQEGTMTNHIRIRASVKIKDEFFTKGMWVRVHLPLPSACQQQSSIRIEKMIPAKGVVSPADAPQRTVCWEKCMEENHAFVVEYSYLHTATYHDVYGKNGALQKDEPFYEAEDLEEQAPHIVFTPYIKALCEELTQGLETPLQKAQAFYDFITLNMKYTYMPSYFLLENIADTCAKNLRGDCGVFALLFVTLCRCAGIPAQWQSGLTAEPDFCGGHDWVRFYAEPFGWIFADPSYGTAAVRLGKEERRQFYFGNLDAYRMVANRKFQAEFTVEKDHWRTDPYDNQLGEIETKDHGLRYEEYVRTKEVLSCIKVY